MEYRSVSWDAGDCIFSQSRYCRRADPAHHAQVIENCCVRGDQDGYVRFRQFVIKRPVWNADGAYYVSQFKPGRFQQPAEHTPF